MARAEPQRRVFRRRPPRIGAGTPDPANHAAGVRRWRKLRLGDERGDRYIAIGDGDCTTRSCKRS